MENRALTEQIYARSFARQWLSPAVRGLVTALVEQGLHAEQIFLGLGLLNLDQYAEVLSEAAGYPFIRLSDVPERPADMPLPSHVRAQAACCPLWQDEQAWHVAFVSPPGAENLTEWKKRFWPRPEDIQPYVMLWSEWRTGASAYPLPSIRRIGRAVHAACQASRSYHIRLAGDCVYAPAEAQPALSAFFMRRGADAGWQVETATLVHAPALHLTRHEPYSDAPHAFDWIAAVESFFDRPAGVLLVQTDDRYVELRLARLAETHAEGLSCQSIRSEADVEELVHAALTGEPRLACLAPAQARSWKDSCDVEARLRAWLEPAQVPVHLIQSSLTSAGRAWEAS